MKPPARLLLRGVSAAVAVCSLCPPAKAGASMEGWQVSGSNTLRFESYRLRGDPSAGPYQFDGGQYYDEISLNLLRQLSPFDTLRAQFFGVINESTYRATDRGLVPERVNLTREKGDAAVPYRFEFGDLFAYFSFRTLQRSLKGVQIELQPAPTASGLRQSVIFVAGANQPDWRQFQAAEDWTSGVSWLVENSTRTRVGANLLQNRRQANAGLGVPDRSQTVASLTGDHAWRWAGQSLRFEGELASLRGDHDGSQDAAGMVAPASGQDRRGSGVFLQIGGRSDGAPLDYRLRFERYDQDFRPAGAVITPDRRSAEAHLSWRLSSGLTLRGRAQQFIDAMQSGNELDTTTYGVNLAGPLFSGTVAGLSASIDAFRQDLKKHDASIDRATLNLNASLTKPLPAEWVGNLGLFWQQVNDHVPGANDVRSTQLQLGATRAINLGGWTGSLTPGLALRRVSGDPLALREWSPALALALTRNAHHLSASYGYQKLRPDSAALATIEVNALRLDYRYVAGANTFGVEACAYDRQVTIGQFNDTYRLSVFWTHRFDKPAQAATRQFSASIDSAGVLPRDVTVLTAITPGVDFELTRLRLDDAGFRGAVRQGNALVFEQRLLNEIEQRQRFAMIEDAGTVKRVVLVIDVDDADSARSLTQTYERVRKALLDRFGSPGMTFDEGVLSPTFIADLSAGRVSRVMEWQFDSGRLRLGIPRRLDGQVRIEIQYASSFGAPRDAAWSIDTLK